MTVHLPFAATLRMALTVSAAGLQPVDPQTLRGPARAAVDEAQAYVYASRPEADLALHVLPPKGAGAGTSRPAFVCFFGGGWMVGEPRQMSPAAGQARRWGMVAILPDYRTMKAHGTTPVESVEDAREALRWIAAHAGELGIDPTRIVVAGFSAGGHVALWSVHNTGEESEDQRQPKAAALALVYPVTDTTETGFVRAVERLGSHAREFSVNHWAKLDLPPTFIVHGTGDDVVPYANSVTLRDRIQQEGGTVELVSDPEQNHGYVSQNQQIRNRVLEQIHQFLIQQHVLQ